MKTTLIAAAITFALAAPAFAQMASDGNKMQAEKPMANGSMAMSADANKDKTMAMKSKKSKKMMADKPMMDDKMMGEKPMTSDQMKSDAMKH